MSSLLAQKTSVKLVSSHVIKAEGKQRTRAGCNSSAEDQAEVEDKAEQSNAPKGQADRVAPEGVRPQRPIAVKEVQG